MGRGNGITADEVIEAIKGSKGFKTVIAKRLGCTYRHVYRLIDKYATAQEALENEREEMKDWGEGQMFKKMESGDTTMIIFYLKTQAKDRGYIERQELASDPDKPLIVKVVYDNPDD
jgi:hypothetical protein